MSVQMYDLAGADDAHRFSPHCWRVRMALAHKGLEVRTLPWRFTEKDRIAASGQGQAPVLVDGDQVVADSWAIALYLEHAYPNHPPLFGCEAAQAQALFIKHWTEQVVQAGLIRLILVDIHAHLHPKDQAYFRQSREQRFGESLEAVSADREARLPAFRKALAPLRKTLTMQPYLGGEIPDFADYTVFGAFQWARCCSELAILEDHDPVLAWRNRLLDRFDGLARKAPHFGP